VPPGLVREAQTLLRRRIEALGTTRDVSALGADHPYHAASDELLALAKAHRHALVFLLRHAHGTAYASFTDDLAASLARLAQAYGEHAYPDAALTASNRRALTRIYRAFLGSIASILTEEASEPALQEAVFRLTTYHLAGMRAFFESLVRPTKEVMP